ncbi:RraA family protein [Alsobacter sp. KACC 23698]|uniref:Putative 4-hydroxy-4-methyl-2-oxoglutarate aldolase n=1 Tax=Alsobacter sp. KACC 23698 TaxID=3149229 RepID=A0AAU7JEG1_9HYPH
MPVGFRVRPHRGAKVSAETVERFRSIPVANVSDSMSRVVAGGPRLRPMHRDGVMAGPALTAKTRPGDNLMLHKAIDMASPGDVIVYDAGGDVTNAVFGELMLAHAIRRGVAGLVIYGAIRDADGLRARNLPVFALGVTHRGPSREGPGEIGYPIAIEGMVIQPGDLVMGDGDGVVCVPYGDLEAVYEAAKKKNDAENRQMEQTEAGQLDRSWVDQTLQRLGCSFEG